MRKVKVLYIITSFKQSGPINQLYYIIKNLDRSVFEPYLLKLNNENNSDEIEEKYNNYVDCELVNTSKLDILIGRSSTIKKRINQIRPDIIHTLGLFPDYLVERLGYKNHILTLRDFCYVGHIDKYGLIRGKLMIAMQEYVMKHCKSVITCSESLSDLYYEKLNRRFPYIRNGVDVRLFSKPTKLEKEKCKLSFGFSPNDLLFIYSGQFIDRKNQGFVIDAFKKVNNKDYKLLLLGDGPLLEDCKRKAIGDDRIIFTGNVKNVHEYLIASDIYLSTSKSEGMPNGVLEAMATGLPVLLSDIDQHKEIFSVCKDIGYLFELDDLQSLIEAIETVNPEEFEKIGNCAFETVNHYFSDSYMSMQYQSKYREIINSCGSEE